MDELDRAGAAVVASPVSEPTPVDRLRPRVRRRVHRRRAFATLAVVLALGLPTAAIAAAARSGRGAVDIHTIDSGQHLPTATTVPAHALRILPRGARVNPGDLFSLTFVDAQHGFAFYGSIGTPLGLASTDDGGATWRARAAVPQKVMSLEFTSVNDGWAFDPDRLVPHNAGQTWTPTLRGGVVDALDVIGSSVWSLVGCSSGPNRCVDQLQRSDDNGRTWRSTGLPGLPAGPAQLDRVDSRRAFVWSAFGPLELARTIVATSDAGASWELRKNPCDRMPGGLTLAGLSAVNGFDLWASCSQSGIPTAAKEVFRSSDGGHTWVLTARVGMSPAANIGKLPISGYGADLVAINDQVAILTSGRGTVSVSTDAGRDWSPAIDFQEFLGTITKLRGSDTVWVGSSHSDAAFGVWRATDGIHFRLIARGTPY